MIVIVTGSSNGIGRETAKKFLDNGDIVHGIDISPEYDKEYLNSNAGRYFHHVADVGKFDQLPTLYDPAIIINNAGCQNGPDDIRTNLIGVMNCTKKYALQNRKIKSVVNLASVSAHNGCEFPEYTASKGGVLSYTVWTAKQIAKYQATCNSISFGGVATELNAQVMNDREKWNDIMNMTPLKKWASAKEAADWIYFVAKVNKSMSGQDIIIDNLEMLNHRFVW